MRKNAHSRAYVLNLEKTLGETSKISVLVRSVLVDFPSWIFLWNSIADIVKEIQEFKEFRYLICKNFTLFHPSTHHRWTLNNILVDSTII